MDINKLLKNVNNIDEYILITQKISDTSKNTKVQINITTVLALKKIRSLEIEYLNKYYANGAACILFERLLSVPPSKIWGVLGKELVSLLQYWLEAIRKYLITHSDHWWSFLKLILKFIKELCVKDPSMPNILVELTAECLFDIASRDTPDSQQRYEILHCLNVVSAESSREIRFALRNKFTDYFNKLASRLATSGYFPCQYSALEALVRWLVPRQDSALRAAAAARWFPGDLCPETAREVFLGTNWMNFFQVSRDFLNALNEANGLVTSVVCRKLTIGNILLISGAEKQQFWLDVNSSLKSISVLLDPRVLVSLGVLEHRACETLVFADDDTQNAQLHSESQELTISLSTHRPPRLQPSDIATGDASDVTIVVSSSIGARKLDTVLRSVFGGKYNLLMDLNTELSLSPSRSRDARKTQNVSEEDTRHLEVRRRKHTGYIVRSINAGGLVSPSTASTSSLAQLHDKLAALPRYKYDKEPVSVCAEPQLSSVTEITETDNRSFHSVSALKFRRFGVCHMPIPNAGLPKATKTKADSDSETLKPKPKPYRHLSPVVRDENSTSCLLVATVGSADESVISDTVERLSKNKGFKNDNIVDLLVQEALQAKPTAKEILRDSGINSGDKKSQGNEENSEAIENTPTKDKDKNTLKKTRAARRKNCTVVSKSTTDDESNTEAINETPALPITRNKKFYRRQSVYSTKETERKVADKQSFDVQTVEQFFSQHFSEAEAGEIVISPSLAKKINASSSESSENFDETDINKNENLNANVEQFQFNDIDIVHCLNEMVDKVCSDFEKCTEYLNEGGIVVDGKSSNGHKGNEINSLEKTLCTKVSVKQTKQALKSAKSIKLTYKKMKGKKTVTKKKKNDIEENPKKMSTIIEQKDEDNFKNNSPIQHNIEDIDVANMNSPVEKGIESPVEKDETPVIKRKRKLYSPKDDEVEKEKKGIKIRETDDDDVVLSKLKTNTRIKTLKTTATCYKDIERERQKQIRVPRSKKSRSKVEESYSPRTLKMNAMFDKLKDTVGIEEKQILADKKTAQPDVYNFTSDSEDEDFREKKIEVQKRTSNTTVGSFESAKSKRLRRPRTRLLSEKCSNDDTKKTKATKRKKTVSKTNSKSKANVHIEPVTDLTDEKMRKTGPEELDSSIVIDTPKLKNPARTELKLHKPPEMEPITNDQEKVAPIKRKPSKKGKKAEILSLNKEKGEGNNDLKTVSDKEEDRTVSPLPGLVVESMPTHKDDTSEFVTMAMIQKFKRIYQEGTDAINDSSITENMLPSDIERCNSPQNVSINITNENYFVDSAKETKAEKSKSNSKTAQNKLSKNIRKIKTKKSSLNKGEVIDISEIPDVQSEKSIATDGVTAHGDFDEAPPSPEMIRKRMQLREIEDLNESMKDCFVERNRKIYDSTCQERRESGNSKDLEISEILQPDFERSPSAISPVVSVHRLSFDDINKWLPSRRTSFTSGSEKSGPMFHDKSETVIVKPKSNYKNIETKTGEKKNTTKELQKNKSMKPRKDEAIVDSPNVELPIAPIATISLEEFNNWFPMPKSLEEPKKDDIENNASLLLKETERSNVKLVYNTRQKSKIIKDVKIPDGSREKNKTKLKSKTELTQRAEKNKAEAKDSTNINTIEQDLDFTSKKVKNSSRKTIKNTSVPKKIKSNVVKDTDDSDSDGNTEINDKEKRAIETNNSIISPVESLEDFVPYAEYNDESDDTFVKKIRQYFSKEKVQTRVVEKDTTLTKSTKEIQSLNTTSTKILSQNSTGKFIQPHSKKIKEKLHDSSAKVEESFKRPMKRSSPPILNETKKQKFEANVGTVTIESEPCNSSVNDWFRRIERTDSHANDPRLLLRDMIQNIMEKLDELGESNRNLSKKLINLSVEVQTELTSRHEERREMYKTSAKQIIAELVSIVEQKFSDLDQRTQQMETDFKVHLKKQTLDLIREDCKLKRAIVLLLKEDVQAVFDYIERRGNTPS